MTTPTTRIAARMALAAAALLLVAGAAAAKPGIAAATVNLRAEANTTSAVVTKIPAGARLEVGDCNDGWCAVTYQGKSGFSIATALDTSGRPRRVLRRLPGVAPDDELMAPPTYLAPPPPPAVVYAPGPYYYYYGPGPYWGPYYGYRRWGPYGWRRW
jgi:hypothetical protein